MAILAPTTVLVVEDHPVVRWGVKSLLLHQADLRIAGEADSEEEALHLARTLRPDVVLVPARLGGAFTGVELCRALRSACEARLVMYTAFPDEVDDAEVVLAGAASVVPKTTDADELVATIRGVTDAGSAVPERHVERRTLVGDAVGQLTVREREVLDHMLDHRTNPEIATLLHLEVSTVKTHVRSVLRKLGVPTRRALFDAARVASR